MTVHMGGNKKKPNFNDSTSFILCLYKPSEATKVEMEALISGIFNNM